MAKIDCSVTVNFLRERQRMCDSHRHGCGNCALREVSRYTEHTCSDYTYAHPETSVKVVQKWSDEHPVKTRLDDLLKKYPNARIDNSPPHFFPYALGYCEDCHNCVLNDRRGHKVCWHEPLAGGATGKAVK